jgi:hypothetical protein
MAYGTVNADVIGTSVANTTLGAGNASAFKNRIINGAQVINQRYGTTAQTGVGGFVTDRFQVLNGSAGTVNAQTVTTAPAGFTYSTQLTVGTADAAVGSTDSVIFYQTLEGYNIADLNWGTANAKTVTLSFWVYSSLIGAYSGSIVDSGGNYSYPFNYTISSANTWEQKTVTITGPTSGTFGKVNDVGFYLELSLMAGSSFQGTPNAWSVGNWRGTSSQINWMATSGNTWYITGVQLEVGSFATGFDYRSYGTELALCQRYFLKTNPNNQSTGGGLSGSAENSNYCGTLYNLPVTMRTSPSVTRGGTTDTWYVAGITGNATAAINGSNYFYTPNSVWMEVGTFSPSITTGFQAVYNGQLSISAEL